MNFPMLLLSLCLLAIADAPRYVDHFQLLTWIDDQGHSHAIKTTEQWEQRRQHILAHMQAIMGPLPALDSRVDLNVRVLETEDLPTLVRKKIVFRAGPGDDIPAYLLIPKNLAARSAPAMLCLHGTSGPRGRTAGLGADYPRYTLELAERGYVTIAPDYTLLGDNQTDPESLGYASGTMKGIWSHMRAVDVLLAQPEVDPERVGTIGVSLGGHNSLFVAAFDKRLKVIVTSSGFDSFADYMNGNPTGWCQKRYMPRIDTICQKKPDQIPFDFAEVLAILAPRALFVHAPQSDSNFKVSSAQKCVDAARTVYKLHGVDEKLKAIYPPGDHGFPIEVRQQSYEFVDAIFHHAPRS